MNAPDRCQSSSDEQIQWIPLASSYPDADITVLVHCPGATDPVWLGFFDGEIWRDVGADPMDHEVTHWADLPEGPKDREASCR